MTILLIPGRLESRGESMDVHGLNDLGIEVELDLYNDIQ